MKWVEKEGNTRSRVGKMRKGGKERVERYRGEDERCALQFSFLAIMMRKPGAAISGTFG